MPHAHVGGHRLHYERVPATIPAGPELVFAHDGLGSAEQWRDLPARVATETGWGATVYSRHGHGQSDPLRGPRLPDFLRAEAVEALPELRRVLGIDDAVLIGHSDGASIALLHAAARSAPTVRGVVAIAPHLFLDERTTAGLRAARTAFASGTLAERLAPHHGDAAAMFHGWNDTWLLPESRAWNIEADMAAIDCPVLAIQGDGDDYGTMAQLDALARRVPDTTQLRLGECGHAPHREREAEVRSAIVTFIAARCRARESADV